MHSLAGPRARIERANGQIISLQQGFQRFFGENLYEIGVAEYNPKLDNYSLRVKSGPKELPVDWSLLIGEIVHNLRAALDGLAWQLALQTTDDPYDRTAFPIYLLDRKTKKRIGRQLFWRKDQGLRLLRSIDPSLHTRIEGFQPYKRGNGGWCNSLFRLEELNNTDKHRLLAVLITIPAGWQFSGLAGGAHIKRGVALNTDAKVGWVKDVPPNKPGEGGIYLLDPVTMKLLEPEMQVNLKITPGVLFGNSCQAVQRLPVIPTLQGIVNEVSRVIESFSDKFPE